MKIFSLRALVSAFSLVIFLVSPGWTQVQKQDTVAQVGSIPISKYELGREIQRILPMNSSYHGGVSAEKMTEIREKALESCIERALKVMYALDNEIVVDATNVKQQFDQVRAKFESQDAFVKALGGETPEAFRSSLFRQSLANSAEQQVIDAKVTISDDEMRTYYDQNVDKFIRPIQYKASHILIKVDPAASSEQRQERLNFAKELLEKARSGEEFYNLAYYNSDDRTKYVGGDLGYFSEGQTINEFEKVVVKMKVGEISDIVETLYGYHIVKLTDIKPAGRMSFAEVQTTLLPQMKKAHRDKAYTDWIEQLRAKYPVKKFDLPE